MCTRKPIYMPEPKEIPTALQAVFYEIETFLWTTEQTYGIPSVRERPNLLESRLLHTRNLIHFFEREQKHRRDDDVLAEDYEFHPRKIGISKIYRDRLNKSLSHMTYARVAFKAQGKREWPIKDTVLPLLDPCEEFLQHLIDTYLQKDNQVDRGRAAYRIGHIKKLRHIINTHPEPPHDRPIAHEVHEPRGPTQNTSSVCL